MVTRPYMLFNKAVKTFLKAQWPRGIQLLTIFERVETYGDKPHDNTTRAALAAHCSRAYEYQVAIHNVLEAYTIDIVEGMVRYGVHNGLDAWRTLYHHYVPLAEDLQQILIQELYD